MHQRPDPTDGADAIDIAAAVNDVEVLQSCLALSPDIASGRARLRTYKDYSTAGMAYNQALVDTDASYLVLVHQDVYLPRGFLAHLAQQLRLLDRADPDWAVAGVIGLDENGQVQGQTWSSGLQRLVGTKVAAPRRATTLDEVLLIVRRAAGVQFDEKLPSFHLYATDVVNVVRRDGHGAYIIHAPVIHHSRPVTNLSGGYSEAYRYLQKKWRAALPLPNLICPIQSSELPLRWRNLRLRMRNRGRTTRIDPPGDPVSIARRLGLDDPA